MMRWARNVAHMENIIDAYTVLVEKPEQKRSFGRPRN
jgi:hypothetical protein